MDMTWSIVAAFVALGYLPPAAFCRDPGFSTGYDEDYLRAAMAESLSVVVRRAQGSLQTLLDKHPSAIADFR